MFIMFNVSRRTTFTVYFQMDNGAKNLKANKFKSRSE